VKKYPIDMNNDMKKILLFVTVFAVAVAVKSNWSSLPEKFPGVEISIQLHLSIGSDNEVRKES